MTLFVVTVFCQTGLTIPQSTKPIVTDGISTTPLIVLIKLSMISQLFDRTSIDCKKKCNTVKQFLVLTVIKPRFVQKTRDTSFKAQVCKRSFARFRYTQDYIQRAPTITVKCECNAEKMESSFHFVLTSNMSWPDLPIRKNRTQHSAVNSTKICSTPNKKLLQEFLIRMRWMP